MRAHRRRRRCGAGVRRGFLRPRHALPLGDPPAGRRCPSDRALALGGRRSRGGRLDERRPAPLGAAGGAAAVAEHLPRAVVRRGPAVLPRACAQLPARGGAHERFADTGRRLRRHLRGTRWAPARGAGARARREADRPRGGARVPRRGRRVPRGGRRARPRARPPRAGRRARAGRVGRRAGAGALGRRARARCPCDRAADGRALDRRSPTSAPAPGAGGGGARAGEL